jgi:hypothetical protein
MGELGAKDHLGHRTRCWLNSEVPPTRCLPGVPECGGRKKVSVRRGAHAPSRAVSGALAGARRVPLRRPEAVKGAECPFRHPSAGAHRGTREGACAPRSNAHPVQSLTRLLFLFPCALLGACVPGKFASGIDGLVVDAGTSQALAGVRVVSTIPHVVARANSDEVVVFTNEDGGFSFSAEYGFFRFLEMDADLRELQMSKEGYEGRKVIVAHRGGERFANCPHEDAPFVRPSGGSLLIKLRRISND